MTFRCAVLGERQVLASWDRFRRHEVGIILDPFGDVSRICGAP